MYSEYFVLLIAVHSDWFAEILALNCLISAYSLSVQYLDGIKFGDYQMSVTGVLMSVCFLTLSRAKVCLNRFLDG